MDLLHAIILAIVEGLTEFLPISSTGHLIVVGDLINFHNDGRVFEIAIQLGAILAVCVIFFHQLNPFSPSKTGLQKRQTWTLWGKTIVACLPAAVIGIPLDDWMEEHLGSPYVIAAALIVYGIAFILIENAREKKASASLPGVGDGQLRPAPKHFAVTANTAEIATRSELADADARVQSVDELDWKTAIGIGLFQVLSMVPGTSRSGSTIIGGLLLGCSRTAVAEFTFYLAIPVMAGASGLRLVKYFLKGNVFSANEAAILLMGCAVAFVISLLVIRFLMSFIRKHDFKPFGWYRIVLGVAVIAYFALVA